MVKNKTTLHLLHTTVLDNRCTVIIFLFFFSTCFHSGVVFLCFLPCLNCFSSFYSSIPIFNCFHWKLLIIHTSVCSLTESSYLYHTYDEGYLEDDGNPTVIPLLISRGFKKKVESAGIRKHQCTRRNGIGFNHMIGKWRVLTILTFSPLLWQSELTVIALRPTVSWTEADNILTPILLKCQTPYTWTTCLHTQINSLGIICWCYTNSILALWQTQEL